MKLNKFIYGFSFISVLLFSCEESKTAGDLKQNKLEAFSGSGTLVASEKITPPEIIQTGENTLRSVIVEGMPDNIRSVSESVMKSPEIFPAKFPVRIIPGENSTSLPEVVAAKDSSVIASEPDVEIAKDMVQNSENHFAFSYFGKLQGLRQDVIKCITQDKRGNLWIGTGGGGVCRYNGINFAHYNTEQGIPNAQVFAVLTDRDANVWIGTFGGGICRFDGRNMSIYSTRQGLSSDKVLCMLEDRSGVIWIGTYGGGLCRFDGNNFTRYGKKQGLPDDIIVSLAEDKSGNVWVGTNGKGICKFDGKAFSHYGVSEGLPAGVIMSLYSDRDGDLWIGTEGVGVFRFDGKNFYQFNTEHGLADNSVLSIMEDRQGRMLFGTLKGMSLYDGQRLTSLTENEGSPRNTIFSFFEDRSGNIWIGTFGGLARYDGRVFTHLTKKQGLLSNTPYCMIEDCSRNIWLGSLSGVSRFNGTSFTHLTKENGLINQTIFSLMEDRSGNIWMGSVGLLYKYSGKNLMILGEKEELGPHAILHMIEDRKGRLWLATGGGGVICYDGKSITRYTTAQGLSANVVYALLEDRRGNIWMGTEGGGLTRFDGKNFFHYNMKSGLNRGIIYALLEDREGRIWMGTNGEGLICFDGKVILQFYEEDGLSNDVIQSLMEDKAGNIWAGARFGITKICPLGNRNPKSNPAASGISNADFLLKKYTYPDGFIGIGCIRNALLEDSGGKIWVGTNDRLTIMNPDELHSDQSVPELEITGIDFFNDQIDWGSVAQNPDTSFKLKNGVKVGRFQFDKLRPWTNIPENLSLNHSNNFLTFRYNAITLSQPQNVVYQHKLSGVDDNWSSPSNKTEAQYSNLRPGDYTFRVKAMSGEGVWTTEKKITFTIRPPWWRTWWAYLLYLPFCFSLLFFFWKWKTGNLLKQRKKLAAEVENANSIITSQKEEVKQKNILLEEQKEETEKHKIQIEKAHDQLEKKNRDIISSLAYARRIQSAILPPAHWVKEVLSNSFIIHRPKDIVAGDFYWINKTDQTIYIAACDCTGHGVPGALMSVVCNSALSRAVNEFGERLPGKILDRTGHILSDHFSRSSVEVNDGMDVSMAMLDTINMKLLWSGANCPLWIIRTKENQPELTELKPDKQSIGRNRNLKPFQTHEINLKQGDLVYLFTDGYANQFGGSEGKKMTRAVLKKYLLSICHLPMEKQHKALLDYYNSFRGNEEQIDDVCVIGVQI